MDRNEQSQDEAGENMDVHSRGLSLGRKQLAAVDVQADGNEMGGRSAEARKGERKGGRKCEQQGSEVGYLRNGTRRW